MRLIWVTIKINVWFNLTGWFYYMYVFFIVVFCTFCAFVTVIIKVKWTNFRFQQINILVLVSGLEYIVKLFLVGACLQCYINFVMYLYMFYSTLVKMLHCFIISCICMMNLIISSAIMQLWSKYVISNRFWYWMTSHILLCTVYIYLLL